MTSSSHISLTSNLISPIYRFGPSSSLNLHFPSSNFSPLSLPTLSLHTNRFLTAVKSSSNSPEGEFEELGDEDESIEIDDDDDDVLDDEVDVDELELEAEKVAREYAVSLSKELKIEEEPVGEKGTRGRRKARESIKAVNVSKHIFYWIVIRLL
ncbi:hypothetical protein Tco_0847547 [Tanacetum coccineum]